MKCLTLNPNTFMLMLTWNIFSFVKTFGFCIGLHSINCSKVHGNKHVKLDKIMYWLFVFLWHHTILFSERFWCMQLLAHVAFCTKIRFQNCISFSAYNLTCLTVQVHVLYYHNNGNNNNYFDCVEHDTRVQPFVEKTIVWWLWLTWIPGCTGTEPHAFCSVHIATLTSLLCHQSCIFSHHMKKTWHPAPCPLEASRSLWSPPLH